MNITNIPRYLILALLLMTGVVHARLQITVTGGAEGALPIAVTTFGWQEKGSVPEDVAAIIRADLARSGRFAPLYNQSLVQRPYSASEIDFPRWQETGSESLVIGQIRKEGERYLVQFQLFDVLRGEQLTGYSIPVSADLFRRAAHKISDIIYEALTGEPGAFNTHVAYVTVENSGKNERLFRLAVADSDGFNEQNILASKASLMSPSWSPDSKQLAYVSFEKGRSVLYIQEILSGKRRVVAEFKGLNSAPAWSPDGKRLAMTLSRDGDPEIYIMQLSTGKLVRITRSRAIDTEPSWAPDGRSLVFTSDRGGRPQIYRIAVNERGPVGRPKRLTFEGNYNARAVFSPKGDRIAMVHGSDGAYRIAVQELSTGNLQVLTQSRLDESPSFSANGQMIIYATELRGRGVLEAVSVDGRAHQRLGLSVGDVREPAWSPFLTK
jgi:TolB protein